MEYVDKSTGAKVRLVDSTTDFLAAAAPDSAAESFRRILDQRVFDISSARDSDGIFVLRVRAEAESLVQVSQALQTLRGDRAIDTIVPAVVDSDGNTRFALPDRVVVRLTSEQPAAADQLAATLGTSVVRRFRTPGLVELAVPAGEGTGAFIGRLNAQPSVSFAEPSFYGVDDRDLSVTFSRAGAPRNEEGTGAGRDGVPDDLDWNLRIVDVEDAWRLTRGSPQVVVAVIDGLPELDHEALQGKWLMRPGAESVFSEHPVVSSHATNVCGVIAGESASFSGLAPGLRLLPVVVDLGGQLYAERAEAIHYVARVARTGSVGGTRVDRVVMCCSWRTAGDIAVIRTALEEAVAAGVVIVCSAGNTNDQLPHYPSAYAGLTAPGLGRGLLAVAATDRVDAKAQYSNFSATVDLCAPGGDGLPLDQRDIRCPDLGNQYVAAAGTSIAAPHVAAAAGLLLSLDGRLSVTEVKSALARSADSIATANPGFEHLLGSGRLNVSKALHEVPSGPVRPAPAPDPPHAPTGSGPRVRVQVRRGPQVTISRTDKE